MLIYHPIVILKSDFLPLKYTDNHQMQEVMRKSHDEPKPITSSCDILTCVEGAQTLNTIMVTLVKLKYAINVH